MFLSREMAFNPRWMFLTGLVILDARYGPSEQDEGTEGLNVDVTVPMQALVNSSQLYIPGKRSKVSRLSP